MTATASTAAAPVIRMFYARVDAGDLDAVCALFAEDARYVRPGYPELTSRAAIDHFYRHERVIRSGRHTLDQILVDRSDEHRVSVAVRGSFVGERHDGAPLAHRFAEFFVLDRAGLITARETFFAVAHV